MHCLEISFATGVILVFLTGNDAIDSPPMKKKDSGFRYESCYDILKKTPSVKGRDGVYEINLDDQKKKVFCDMTTEGGGWTVIQKRIDGSTDFYKNWVEYKNGFGDPCKNYLIGNEAIHILTKKNDQVLRVDLQSFDCDQTFAKYSTFHVGNEASKYTLSVSGFTGPAGDSLKFHNGMKFSTYDQDHDRNSTVSCATQDHAYGAWWYNDCYKSNLNGKYADSALRDIQYPAWNTWKNHRALKGTLMMVRPK